MSPVSRGRKGKRNKKATRQRALPVLIEQPGECDCPACTGEDFDPRQLIDDLVQNSTDLAECDDPLEAEVVGGGLLSTFALAGDGYEEVVASEFIPQITAQATTDALALLLAIGSVAHDPVAKAASAAADRLVASGVARPAWADELSQPVTVADCQCIRGPEGTWSMLACTFDRAGRSHAVIVAVDEEDCGAAEDILLLDGSDLPGALAAAEADARKRGLTVETETLDPAEFRWQVERALDARAVHDDGVSEEDAEDLLFTEDGPGYLPYAAVLRARMHALPVPDKPPAPHGDEGDGHAGLTAIQMLKQLAGEGNLSRPAGAKLPPKRKKSDGPAPVYQIKVGLRGAKPPIWRRLEVPADIGLTRLHWVIQIAFGWHDSHMHAFETPYGAFGIADRELGHRAEGPVTLEQVAPAASSKLTYTYDFGDDWTHEILVEKVLDRGAAAVYPRCTGGRRTAPPEDCGGIWGYANLVEILNDPTDPEHGDRLEWLGLDEAADFDPDRFDAEAVTRALTALR